MSNDPLLAELTAARRTRGVFAAIRTLRQRGLTLPLAVLYLLRLRRR